jgi:hypothetical protein
MPLSYDHLDVNLNVNNTLDIDNDVLLSPRDDSSRKVSTSRLVEKLLVDRWSQGVVNPFASFQSMAKVVFMLRFRSTSTVTERPWGYLVRLGQVNRIVVPAVVSGSIHARPPLLSTCLRTIVRPMPVLSTTSRDCRVWNSCHTRA